MSAPARFDGEEGFEDDGFFVKDPPLAAQLLLLLRNEELLRLANRKMHRIGAETGVMEGEDKLQLVVDKRIYVELQGKDGAAETELVAFPGKHDFKAIAKFE